MLASCAHSDPLPILGQVSEFQLIDQSGRPFDSRSLSGQIWIADFIYTTCTGPCPMMSSRMARLQSATAGMPRVRLVSFTVDPAHDTPEVLEAYGRNFRADPARWSFLTGDAALLNRIGRDSFHLNAVDGGLDHSIRFALVDGQGRIRGYYSMTEDGFQEALLRGVRALQAEQG